VSWVSQIADPVAQVATRLGYAVGRSPSAAHCKCPVCGAEKRHRRAADHRGAVGMPHARPMAWRCFQCDAAGDSLDFVSYHLGGARFRELTPEVKAEVRDWFGVVDDRAPSAPMPRERPVQLENLESEYPPLGEVEALWSSCAPVDVDAEVYRYLAYRAVGDVGRLVDHDCARAMTASSALPQWARSGDSSWLASGHRLIVPLYDCFGVMRSVVARSIERNPRRKSLGVQGHGRRGLVMAGSYGREMLVTGAMLHWHRLERLRLTVTEGEVDFLRAVASGADDVLEDDYRPAAFRAVVGIFAGSFTRDVAWRVPSGTTVVLATDADEQGDKYAAEIQVRIGERCSYERVRMAQDNPSEVAK
jgi:hypothetical protein